LDFSKFNRKNVAAAFGVNTSTIHRWVKQGMPKNGDTYDLRACIDWFASRSCEEPTPESQESQHWLTAFRRERAKIVRLERRRIEGELIPVEEVKRQFVGRAHEFAKGLDLLARRISLQVAAKSRKTYTRVFEIIETECHALLEAYSRPLPGIHGDNKKASDNAKRPWM